MPRRVPLWALLLVAFVSKFSFICSPFLYINQQNTNPFQPPYKVGVALIGGALTWINRHGGCARRNNKRSADFKDYGLADTDFPHNHQPHMQSPGMQTVSLAANGAAIGGGAVATSAAMTPALGAASTSPTIPRLNEQGTFYGGSTVDDPYNNSQQQFMPAYQPQLENGGTNHTIVDYNNVPMDYNQQQQHQQPYYYQQPQDINMGANGGYYDESGYYYDGSTQQQQQVMPTAGTANHSSNPSYDMTAQYNQHAVGYTSDQQPVYPNTNANVNMGDQYYKPDQVDINPHHQRM